LLAEFRENSLDYIPAWNSETLARPGRARISPCGSGLRQVMVAIELGDFGILLIRNPLDELIYSENGHEVLFINI
jgi:hypothetical protein